MDKSSKLSELRSALSSVRTECLNESVLAGKKWGKSINRFQALKVKLEEALEQRI